jgi:2,3-bisphosphoglycerate-dependent phosphoglycerate mutase
VDAPLTEKGLQEAKRAGELIKANGLQFQKAYSQLIYKEPLKLSWSILEESDQMWIPVEKHWRLNESHYGGLQGLNKQETRDKFGEDQVFQWRRSYATLPPEATGPLQEEQMKDRRYQSYSAESVS